MDNKMLKNIKYNMRKHGIKHCIYGGIYFNNQRFYSTPVEYFSSDSAFEKRAAELYNDGWINIFAIHLAL